MSPTSDRSYIKVTHQVPWRVLFYHNYKEDILLGEDYSSSDGLTSRNFGGIEAFSEYLSIISILTFVCSRVRWKRLISNLLFWSFLWVKIALLLLNFFCKEVIIVTISSILFLGTKGDFEIVLWVSLVLDKFWRGFSLSCFNNFVLYIIFKTDCWLTTRK